MKKGNFRMLLRNLREQEENRQCDTTMIGWRSEQLPNFDIEEINEIIKDCTEKEENLQTLLCRIWNKGYMTAVADERND